MKRLRKVAVAMSGGVDSAVCAALLIDRGFDVIGITAQMAEPYKGYAAARLRDAKKTAKRLGIPHYTLDFRDIFRKKIIGDFCSEYQRGKTPNPCIRCNKYIKFDALFKKAKELGACYIATGHYARIEKTEDRRQRREFNEKSKAGYVLKKGIDAKKDQSYFLYSLSQKQLKQTLLPLGELTKKRVREIAKEKHLPIAEDLESQEICFIPDNNYGEFLKAYLPQKRKDKPGPIVNKEGKVIGEHQGIIFYTIGQRKGIGIADKEALYVTSIDKRNNTITVGKKKDVYGDELLAENIHFISVDKFKAPLKTEAKIRYLHPPAKAAVIAQGKDRVKVKFDRPQWAITPGQAVVFYKGDMVVGGGTICSKKY